MSFSYLEKLADRYHETGITKPIGLLRWAGSRCAARRLLAYINIFCLSQAIPYSQSLIYNRPLASKKLITGKPVQATKLQNFHYHTEIFRFLVSITRTTLRR